MSIWYGNIAERYVIKAGENDTLPQGYVLLADEAARDAWTASFHAAPAFSEEDYSAELDSRLDAIAVACRYSSMASMRSYAGFSNPYQEECLPYALWSAMVWKKVDELQALPPSGPTPTPAQFASLILSLVPPPGS